MLNLKVVSGSLAIFAAVMFVLCVLYGMIVPPALHDGQALEMLFPGFRWLTPAGFLLGLAESLVYGALAGLVFVPIYNGLLRRSRVPVGASA